MSVAENPTDWRESIAQTRADGRTIIAGAKPPAQAVTIYCDGAVLGNPGGPGGWGIVAMSGAEVIYRAHGPLAKQTNNEAEYEAIIRALTWLNESEAQPASAMICSDSALAVNQITGVWGCRAPNLWVRCNRCQRLISALPMPVTVEWIPREANLEADLEAARGVAEALGVDEEEALFLLTAQRKKHQFLRMNKKAKRMLFNAGLVSNLVTVKHGQRVIELGIPFAAMGIRERQKQVEERRRLIEQYLTKQRNG